MNNQPKIIFFGTPVLCLPILERLCDIGMEPSLIVTSPDKPVGRKQVITPPPVKKWALDRGIPLLQPPTLDDHFYKALSEFSPDLSIVVAYGQIIPEKIINLPTYGIINIHYSLLPRWRGATPVESAILNDDKETGVSIQKMVYKLDAGPIISEASIELAGDEFTEDLKSILNEIAADLLAETLPEYLNGNINPTPQDESNVSKCKRLKKSDGEITLDMSDEKLWRHYRAYHHWPGIFFFNEDGKRIKITDASYQNNKFIIESVIPEGKKEIPYDTYIENI